MASESSRRNCPHDTPTVVHSSLNTTFHGIKHPVSNQVHQLEQFRGIKYASIDKRFRRSKLVSEYPEHVDATKYGPIAPQAKVRDVDQSLYGLQPGQYPLESFPQSEFECLNLNITAPAYLSPESRVPVMVWVHGGGNVGGNGSRWLLDGGHLVRRSMENGRGIVFVAINYRLGLFGFAASQEIKSDNASAGDKGVGNYGLHDQLNALRWIHRYISAFGGDSSRITVCGQGKGAVDVHALLLAGLGHESHLVYRAILQSGTCPPPSTYPTAGQQGIELMRVCNLLKIPLGDGALEKLCQVPADELVRVCTKARVRISPTNDGVFFRPSLEFSNPIPLSPIGNSSNTNPLMGVGGMDPPDRLGLGIDAILLGDTYTEATPYTPVASSWTATALSKRIRAILRSPYKADAVLRSFEVGDFGSDGEEDRWGNSSVGSGRAEYGERVGELMADCLVGYGVERLANRLAEEKALAMRKQRSQKRHSQAPATSDSGPSTNTKVYRYLFDQPSPFNLTAHHTVDLVYLFGNIDFEKACSEPRSIGNTPSGSEKGFEFGENLQDSSTASERKMMVSTGSPTVSPTSNPFGGWDEHSGYQMPHISVWNAGSNNGWYEEKRICEEMQLKWIEFVCGQEPWGEYWPVLPKGWGEPEGEQEGPSILATPDPSPQLEPKPLSTGSQATTAGTSWDPKKFLNPNMIRAIEMLEQACEESGICDEDGLLRPPTKVTKGSMEKKDTVPGGDGETKGKEKEKSHGHGHNHGHNHLPHDPLKMHHEHESLDESHDTMNSQKLDSSPISRNSSLSALSSALSQRSQYTRKKALESLQGKVFIFGPAGDTYAAPVSHLAQHRRVDQWREAFEDCPLNLKSGAGSMSGSGYEAYGGVGGDEDGAGEDLEFGMESCGFRMGSSALEEKEIVRIGMELSNGPPEWGRR